jgi:hypothetical protein
MHQLISLDCSGVTVIVVALSRFTKETLDNPTKTTNDIVIAIVVCAAVILVEYNLTIL